MGHLSRVRGKLDATFHQLSQHQEGLYEPLRPPELRLFYPAAITCRENLSLVSHSS